jgi:hypothetical protein
VALRKATKFPRSGLSTFRSKGGGGGGGGGGEEEEEEEEEEERGGGGGGPTKCLVRMEYSSRPQYILKQGAQLVLPATIQFSTKNPPVFQLTSHQEQFTVNLPTTVPTFQHVTVLAYIILITGCFLTYGETSPHVTRGNDGSHPVRISQQGKPAAQGHWASYQDGLHFKHFSVGHAMTIVNYEENIFCTLNFLDLRLDIGGFIFRTNSQQ